MKSKLMDVINTDFSANKEQLMDELHAVLTDAEALLQATTSHTGEGAAAARARIQKSLQAVKKTIAATEAAVIEQTKQAAKATDQYVHDNPWKAVGISAAVGVVVGILVAKR